MFYSYFCSLAQPIAKQIHYSSSRARQNLTAAEAHLPAAASLTPSACLYCCTCIRHTFFHDVVLELCFKLFLLSATDQQASAELTNYSLQHCSAASALIPRTRALQSSAALVHLLFQHLKLQLQVN
jgi:hypothetical protein